MSLHDLYPPQFFTEAWACVEPAHRQPGRQVYPGLLRRARQSGSGDRTDLQLADRRWQAGRGLRQRAQLRSPGLRGGRHLRHLRAPASAGHRHQPAAARRTHGVRALAGPDLHRAAAEGRKPAAAGALTSIRHGAVPASRLLRRSDVRAKNELPIRDSRRSYGRLARETACDSPAL